MKKILKNSNPPTGVVYFNYRTSKATLPDAHSLPTLVKDEAIKAILLNEENPVWRTEAIDFPVEGTGGIYTEQFFESFLDRMKTHPFGGNKLGHSYPAKNDFYTVGGKIEKSGSGKGTVFLKIVIPSSGYETTNSGFIRDVLAGNVHFSLVTLPEYEMKKNEKSGEMEKYMIKSIGFERNDAVPFEGGAMKQVVNSFDHDYKQVRSLIENGKVDYKTKSDSDEIIQYGQVTYSVLRRIAASADSRTPELSELVSLADKQRNRRKIMDDDKVITREEAIKALKNFYANAQTSMKEIAEGIGSTAPIFLRNETDEANAKLVNSVRGLLKSDNLIEELQKLVNTKTENEKFLVQNAVRAQVGHEKIKNAKGEEVANAAYEYAMKMCNGKTGQELKNSLEELKTDNIMQRLLSEQADHASEFNRIEEGGSKKNSIADAPSVLEV